MQVGEGSALPQSAPVKREPKGLPYLHRPS